MWKSLFILFGLTLVAACQSASSRSVRPFNAGTLTGAYQESNARVRSQYDGKEITIRGYTPAAAKMPRPGDDQGSVRLEEKGQDAMGQVTCWFSTEQAAAFSEIKGGEYLTVKGIFNGEAGVELKFCKLVKVN